MKVALVIERIEAWRGGAETSTMQFAHHLADGGCDVSVVTTSHAPSTPSMTIVPIQAGAGSRAGKTTRFARRAADYVCRHPFDVVHCITPCPAADVYQPRGGTVPEMLERNRALRSGRLPRGLKRLAQRMNPKMAVMSGLERDLLNRQPPPWVIAISQYVADQLARHYRTDPSRVRRIFNGVDPDDASTEQRERDRREIRRQFGIGTDDLFVLCIAHNFKLKGVARLIEALARREARPDGDRSTPASVRAVIVGRDNPAPYARLAQRLGLTDRVLFAGPTQRIGAFFHAADLLAHPTYYDPCSRVVLEGLAAGLPVITTRFNGAAERITDGREGYVIDSPTDVDDLADRIDRLADPQHRRDCAGHAPGTVEHITMKQHAADVRELYEDVVAQGKESRRAYR